MHPQLIMIVAQQRIADLHRAGDHARLAHTATSSHAVPAPRHAAAAPVTLIRRLHTQHGRLEPREDQAGDCK
jgi:hypothetical protein